MLSALVRLFGCVASINAMAESSTPRADATVGTGDGAGFGALAGDAGTAPGEPDATAPFAIAVARRAAVDTSDAPAEWRSPQAMRSEPSAKADQACRGIHV